MRDARATCSRCCSATRPRSASAAPSTSVAALAVSPDGRLLATGDETGVVRFMDLGTWRRRGAGAARARPSRPGDAVRARRADPGGRHAGAATARSSTSSTSRRAGRAASGRGAGSWRTRSCPRCARVRARRPPARGRRGEDLDASRPADRPAAARCSTPAAGAPLWRARVPDAPGPVGGARRASARTAADHLRPAGRDDRVGRADGPDRAALSDRRAVALSPDGRTLALALDSPYSGDPAPPSRCSTCGRGRRPDLATTCPTSGSISVAFTADGARSSAAPGHARLGRRVGHDRRDVTRSAGGPRPGVVLDRRGPASPAPATAPSAVGPGRRTQRLGRRFRWGANENGCVANPCTVTAPRGDADGDQPVRRHGRVVDCGRRLVAHAARPQRRPRATALAFTPDGRRLVTGGGAGTVTIWDRRRARSCAGCARAPVFATADLARRAAAGGQRQARARRPRVEVRDLGRRHAVQPAGPRRRRRPAVQPRRPRPLRLRLLRAARPWRVGRAVGRRSGSTHRRRQPGRSRSRPTRGARSSATRTATCHLDAQTGRGARAGDEGRGRGRSRRSPSPRRAAVRGRRDFGRRRDAVGHPLAQARRGRVPRSPRGSSPGGVRARGRLLITELGARPSGPRPADPAAFACQVAGRDLTRDEWQDVLPNRPYRRVCPD